MTLEQIVVAVVHGESTANIWADNSSEIIAPIKMEKAETDFFE
jgi:hypothetical protein